MQPLHVIERQPWGYLSRAGGWGILQAAQTFSTIEARAILAVLDEDCWPVLVARREDRIEPLSLEECLSLMAQRGGHRGE